jgi:hypothetical protein
MWGIDMRQFKKLKMFLRRIFAGRNSLQDDQMVGFIRFGNDFTQNFLSNRIPLKALLQLFKFWLSIVPTQSPCFALRITKLDLSLRFIDSNESSSHEC